MKLDVEFWKLGPLCNPISRAFYKVCMWLYALPVNMHSLLCVCEGVYVCVQLYVLLSKMYILVITTKVKIQKSSITRINCAPYSHNMTLPSPIPLLCSPSYTFVVSRMLYKQMYIFKFILIGLTFEIFYSLSKNHHQFIDCVFSYSLPSHT